MAKIAVIDDDPDIVGLVSYNLEKEGHAVSVWTTGRGAVDFCRRERPHLVFLDVMLPEVDGFEICKSLREQPDLCCLPIILVTARSSEVDRVLGLEIGANDYLVKPFSVRELIARIKVQLKPPTRNRRHVEAGALSLHPESCTVLVNGEPLPLTATEFRLLEHLMSHPGMVFSRGQLLDSIWGYNRAVTDRTVDVFVMRLRRKLDELGAAGGYIRSVRGFGYMFSRSVPPPAEMPSPEARRNPRPEASAPPVARRAKACGHGCD